MTSVHLTRGIRHGHVQMKLNAVVVVTITTRTTETIHGDRHGQRPDQGYNFQGFVPGSEAMTWTYVVVVAVVVVQNVVVATTAVIDIGGGKVGGGGGMNSGCGGTVMMIGHAQCQ